MFRDSDTYITGKHKTENLTKSRWLGRIEPENAKNVVIKCLTMIKKIFTALGLKEFFESDMFYSLLTRLSVEL